MSTYGTFPDYALEQIVDYQGINSLLSNIRHLSEDVLGIENGDTAKDYIEAITLNDTRSDPATDHSGAIYFNSGTAKWFRMKEDGSTLESNNFIDITTSSKKVLGDRVVLTFDARDTQGNLYMSTLLSSGYAGYRAPVSGSIVGVGGWMARVLSEVADYDFDPSAYVNGTRVLSAPTLSIPSGTFAGGSEVNSKVTQARGVDTFSAGDYIDGMFYNAAASGTERIACVIQIEVVLDE